MWSLALVPHGIKKMLEFISDFCTRGGCRHVPRSVKALKMDAMLGDATGQGKPGESTGGELNARVVVFRYAEYCVTAPLLFLSVVSLLTVDAPAWLYISGYFSIVACNLWGIVLHYSITWKEKGTGGGDNESFILWFNSLLLTGTWYAVS
jgi:hypothetical protein